MRKALFIGEFALDVRLREVTIEAVPWGNIEMLKNPRDYDDVVINLFTLDPERFYDWDVFESRFDITTMVDILQYGGRVVILGDPRKQLTRYARRGNMLFPDLKHLYRFYTCTGLSIAWHDAPGEQTAVVKESFRTYLKHLRTWQYSARGATLDMNNPKTVAYVNALQVRGIGVDVSFQPICKSRYDSAIAFEVVVRFLGLRPGALSVDVQGDSMPLSERRLNPLVFLPDVGLATSDVPRLILQDLYGPFAQTSPPAWTSRLAVPGEEDLSRKVQGIQAEVESMQREVKQLVGRREDLRDAVRVLYATDKELEEVVKRLMRELGAIIEDPASKGQEDGWITIPLMSGERLLGALEVKGTEKSEFSEDGRRQLHDWVKQGIEKFAVKPKGIFVGINARKTIPCERPWGFSAQWVKRHKAADMVAIKGEHLYVLWVLDKHKMLDREAFWKDLFTTNGVFEIQRHLPASLDGLEVHLQGVIQVSNGAKRENKTDA